MTVQKTTLRISPVQLPKTSDFANSLKTSWAKVPITSIRMVVCVSSLSLAAVIGIFIPMVM